MAKREGESGEFHIGTASVAEIRSWSLNQSPSSKEARAMGDTTVTIRYGPVSITGELTLYSDNTDTDGQEAISANGTASAATIYPTGQNEGDEEISLGNVAWADITESAEVDGWVEKTVSFSAESITEGTYTTS